MGSGLNRVVGNFFGQGASLFYALSGVSLYIVFFDRLNEPGFTAGFYRRRFFPIAQLFYCALLVWSTIFISNGGSIEWLKFFTSATLLFNFVPGWYDSYEAAGWTVGVEVIFYVGLLFLLTLVRSARVAVVLWIFSVIFSTSGETIDVSLRQFGSLVGGTYPMFSE